MTATMGYKGWVRGALVGALALAGLGLTGCNPTMVRTGSAACELPESARLAEAMTEARGTLEAGCTYQFGAIFDQLLVVGAGDPKPENKRLFSDYLMWASDQGVISPLQAKETYTRYFGTKFVSALGDYNTCAQTCPVKGQVLTAMREELADMARGLMEVAQDRAGYTQADRLYQEMELVISATCEACTPSREVR
jgi:hypothetical protein